MTINTKSSEEAVSMQVLLALLLVFSAFVYGCVEAWSQVILFSLVFLMALLWLSRMLLKGRMEFVKTGIDMPLLLFFAIALAGLFVSVHPYATKVALLWLLSWIVLLYIITNSLDNEAAVMRVVGLVLLVAAAISVIGILRSISPAGSVIASVWKYAAFSTFTNTSHFSAYVGMAVPLGIALVFCELNPNYKFWVASLVFLMIGALVVSADKGGVIQIAASLFALFVFLRAAGLVKHRGEMTLFALLIILISAIVIMNGSSIAHKFSGLFYGGLENSPNPTLWKRWVLWQDTLRMIRARPLLGSGLGTFQFVYPQFRNPRLIAFFEFAHQEYLQIASETGILGLAAFFWFLFAFFKSSIRSMGFQKKTLLQGVIVGGSASCFGLLVHNLYEFNFHIPALTILFVTIAALTLRADLLVTRKIRGNPLSVPRIGRPKASFFIVLAIIVFSVCAYLFSLGHYISVFHYTKGKDLYERLEFSRAAEALNRSVYFNPRNERALAMLANIHAIRSQMNSAEKHNDFKRAEQLYKQALGINKLSAEVHLRLGWLYSVHRRDDLAEEEFIRAVACDPHGAFYVNMLGDFYARVNKFSKAVESYRKALGLNPQDEYARKRLEALSGHK